MRAKEKQGEKMRDIKDLMKEKEGQFGGIIGDLHAKLERKEKEIEDL